MDDWSDVRLAEVASRAFTLGLQDGRANGRSLTSLLLATALGLPEDRRVMHRTKLRQVYGAGFAIGAGQARMAK